VRFEKNNDQHLFYNINYNVDGGATKNILFDGVQRSSTAKYKHDTIYTPGAEKIFYIELKDGEHNINFWLKSENQEVAVRFFFKPYISKKISWVPLTPSSSIEPVNIESNEEIVKYYRFSDSKPLKVKINGPTSLKILTRVENHANMKGRINYRLQIKQDGEIKNTYKLNSIRSETATYKNDKKKIPGKAKEIVIFVPKGKHILEIKPLDKDKSTLLGRVLFPKKDVKLSE
jgi:hypothetical protein